jgi:hypothetical protein
MSNYETQAANVIGPTKGSINVVAATATPGSINLDAAGWYDEYVTLQADGGNVYVLLAATAAIAAALDDTATGTGDTVCGVIQDGTERGFRLKRGVHKFLGYKTASGSTATLRAFVSSDQAG